MYEATHNLEVGVPDRAHSDKVQVNTADDVATRQARMLLRELLVTNTTYDELVLTRLTAIDVVICVEEGTIGDHKGHLKALVRDLEVTILINRLNRHLLVVLRQNVFLVPKQLDESIRHDVFDFDLTDVECTAIAFPDHVVHHV